MASYIFRNIRQLLAESFSDDDLRRFLFDHRDFRAVYDELSNNSGKAIIIDRLLEFADQKLLCEPLLIWAHSQNPVKYAAHWPYAEGSTDDLNIPIPFSHKQATPQVSLLPKVKQIELSDLVQEGMAKLISLEATAPAVLDQLLPLTADAQSWLEQMSTLEVELELSIAGSTLASNDNGRTKALFEAIISFDKERQDRDIQEVPSPSDLLPDPFDESQQIESIAAADPETDGPLSPPWLTTDQAAIAPDIRFSEPPERSLPNLKEAWLRPPRLSTMVVEEIHFYQRLRSEVRFRLQEAEARIQSVDENVLAGELIQQFSHAELATQLEPLYVRLQTVRHLLQLRKFAKLYVLSTRWPELGRQLREKISFLIQLEGQASQPQPLAEGTNFYKLWQQYQDDEDLLALLRLHPLIGDISLEDLNEYFNVAQTIPLSTKLTSEMPQSVPTKGQTKPPSEPETVSPTYHNLVIHFTKVSGEFNTDQPLTYQLEIVRTNVNPIRVEFQLRPDDPLYAWLGPAQASTEFSSTTLGQILYTSLFPGEARTNLLAVLQSYTTRLVLQLDPPELARLPWECLYLPELDLSVAVSPRHSLVRTVSQLINPPSLPHFPEREIHLLLISQATNRVSQRENEEIAAALRKNSVSKIAYPNDLETTASEIISSFHPHILHFLWESARPELASLVGPPISLGTVGNWLKNSGSLALVVFNVMIPFDQQMDLICQTGVVGGILTTAHPANQETALLFSRTLYTFLGDGFTPEEAMIQTRLALKRRSLDWSPYALITPSLVALTNFRLLPR